ncbi:MAG TPA: DUF2092 domain-containing protein [Burkholderiaceae bacterium]|nr:DUF2092 domain-containing protein [Burkholderiaceae bacterium]HQR69367.1 DUF2092 domain-containing protein [Burkholderiaceae bacterium]
MAKKPAAKPAARPAAQPEQFKMVLEPRAVDLLKAMSARLAAARTLSFTAVAGYEFPSKLGPPLVYTTRFDVALARPDKFRVLMPGDGPASEFYYDGKTMVAYAPVENLAAIADAPPTIDAMLKSAYQTAAIFFPFTDLVLTDPYSALADGKLAFYIGPSGVVGGVKTEMVAWANDDVFMQVWIGVDDKLPRRVRAMYSADPLGLRHELELSNWQLDGPIAAEAFASAKVANAGRMAFATPSIKLPPGMKPVAFKKTPAKPAPKSN